MAATPKLVVITRRTALEELVARFGTRDQARFAVERGGGDFASEEAAHATYRAAVERLRDQLPAGLRVQWVERALLPTFLFGPSDVVAVLGQDGLVVNAAKYLDGQPVVAINPDPARIDGVLLPWRVEWAATGIALALAPAPKVTEVTMAEATLGDGQRLLAVNDLFLGPRSHVSARYRLRHAWRDEVQSSSGIIVSTGAGSTGWFRAVLAGAAGVAEGFGAAGEFAPLRDDYRFGWSERKLAFCVREPFASRTSGASVVFGWVTDEEPLVVESRMPRHGVLFGDGVEEDAIEFNAGAVATIRPAARTLRLVLPG